MRERERESGRCAAPPPPAPSLFFSLSLSHLTRKRPARGRDGRVELVGRRPVAGASGDVDDDEADERGEEGGPLLEEGADVELGQGKERGGGEERGRGGFRAVSAHPLGDVASLWLFSVTPAPRATNIPAPAHTAHLTLGRGRGCWGGLAHWVCACVCARVRRKGRGRKQESGMASSIIALHPSTPLPCPRPGHQRRPAV